MNRSTDLNELLQRCLNGTLDETQERELARLLQESSAARQTLRSYLRIEGGLLSLAEARTLASTTPMVSDQPRGAAVADVTRPSPNKPSTGRNPFRRRIAIGFFVVAATVLLVVGAVHWFTPAPPSVILAPPANVAQVDATRRGEAEMSEVVGNVEIIAEGQDAKPAGTASKLLSGQTVRTGGDSSSAAVVYPDGTRLDLASATVARLWQSLPTEPAQKRVFLTAGMLGAEMPPSTDDTPMIVSTPHAEVRLHGAKLAFSVDSSSTYVELVAGRAELIRNVDGQPLSLTQGSFVVSTNRIEPMVVQPVPAAPAEPRATWKISGPTLAYAPDHSFLAVPWKERIQVCHPETGESLFTLSGHKKDIQHVAITTSGKQLVSGGFDPFLIVWDVAARQEQRRLLVGPSGTRCLTLSPDGRLLASVPAHVRRQGLVTLWDMSTGDEVRKLEDARGEVESVTFAPDGRLLAAVTGEHRIVLWNPHTGMVVQTLALGKVRPQILAFSSDGRYLIGACQDQKIRFWDTSSWEIAGTHSCGMSGCGSLAAAPGGNVIAWGLNDGTVEVWKIEEGFEMRQVAVYRKFRKRGPESLAFSPDARTLATTRSWESVKLWDVPKE